MWNTLFATQNAQTIKCFCVNFMAETIIYLYYLFSCSLEIVCL